MLWNFQEKLLDKILKMGTFIFGYEKGPSGLTSLFHKPDFCGQLNNFSSMKILTKISRKRCR
jgi:hypothetical protein